MQHYTKLALGKDGDSAKTWMLADGQLRHMMAQNVHLSTDVLRWKFSLQTVVYRPVNKAQNCGFYETETFKNKLTHINCWQVKVRRALIKL